MKTNSLYFISLLFIFAFTSCGDDDEVYTPIEMEEVPQETPVTLDLSQFPYNTLSEYNFFEGLLNEINPVYGVLPVAPITPLFTDYAEKRRFIWIPPGQKARYVAGNKELDFPTGSALIKVFSYSNVLPSNTERIMETRLMVKKETGWEFAEYVWNEEQTEAFLETTGDGDFIEVDFVHNGESKNVNYRIPAMQQCIICHKNDGTNVPLGIKPESINSVITYDDGPSNQLQKLIDFGYLENTVPDNITTVGDWTDTTLPLELRMRSYIDINCGNCHKDGGQGDYRRLRLSFTDTQNNLENIGVCVEADTPIPQLMGTKLIEPGDIENSIIYYRMSVEEGQYKMPQFGQSLVHTEGLALMEEWINSLTQICD